VFHFGADFPFEVKYVYQSSAKKLAQRIKQNSGKREEKKFIAVWHKRPFSSGFLVSKIKHRVIFFSSFPKYLLRKNYYIPAQVQTMYMVRFSG